MRPLRLTLLTVIFFAGAFSSAPAAERDFEGVWTGEIIAPTARVELGLAFIRTPQGLLVSLNFPEMFLTGANFGAAHIADDTFLLAPLHLQLALRNDTLTGTFGLAKFPVSLHRAGAFPSPPPPPSIPAAPAPAWQRSLDAPVWASPVARDGIVYVGATDGKFHATRADDGTPLWLWTGPHPIHGAALATEENIFFIDDASRLICLDRAAGTLLWHVALHDAAIPGEPSSLDATSNHRAPTPILDEKGILYAGSADGGIYAVRARNGRRVWRHDAKARVYAPLALDGTTLHAACFDGSVLTLNARNGREISRAKLGGPLVSAPLVADGRIVVGARDYILYGLDARTGAVSWRHPYWFSWVESTPRLLDGVLYIGGSDFRRVSALDARTGARHWATDVLGLSWGTPVVTADAVYAATAGRNLTGAMIQHAGGIVALDRFTGKPRWRHVAPPVDGADFFGFAGSLVEVDRLIVGVQIDGTLLALPLDPQP